MMRSRENHALRGPILYVLFAVLATSTSGCITTKSFVDPSLPAVSYGDLKAQEPPTPVVLVVEFMRNGKPYPRGLEYVRPRIEAELSASRVFLPATKQANGSLPELHIVMDNIGDVKDAAGKGFAAGLSFGIAGSVVTDSYLFTGIYTTPERPSVTKTYRHAIHTRIGNAKPPAGLTPMKTSDAVDQVVKDLVLNLVRDLQDELSKTPQAET